MHVFGVFLLLFRLDVSLFSLHVQSRMLLTEGGFVWQGLFTARMAAHANSAGYSSPGVDTHEVSQLVVGLVPSRPGASHFGFRPGVSTLVVVLLKNHATFFQGDCCEAVGPVVQGLLGSQQHFLII